MRYDGHGFKYTVVSNKVETHLLAYFRLNRSWMYRVTPYALEYPKYGTRLLENSSCKKAVTFEKTYHCYWWSFLSLSRCQYRCHRGKKNIRKIYYPHNFFFRPDSLSMVYANFHRTFRRIAFYFSTWIFRLKHFMLFICLLLLLLATRGANRAWRANEYEYYDEFFFQK